MLLATVLVGHEAIALEQTFQELPEMELEAERIAAHSTTWTMPCVWVSDADFDAVDETLANDPSIDAVVETDVFETEKYYHLDWSDDVERRIDDYLDQEGSLLTARATDEGWRVRFRFVTREQFDAFRKQLRERDVSYTLLELTEPGTPRQSFGNLTPEQRDTLVAAMEQGYFEVPRKMTGRELADELGKSHQAVSELLRRGTGRLVDAMLTTGHERE
jgi:hypothetical protein